MGEIRNIGMIWNDLTMFFIPVLGHRWDNLERKMYTNQPLRTGRLVEDMKVNHWE